MLVINTPWSSLYNRACTNPHPEVTDTQVQCTFLKNYPQLLQSGEGNYKQNTTLSSVTAAHQVLRTTKNVLTTKGRVRVSCAMRPQCPSYCCAQAIILPYDRAINHVFLSFSVYAGNLEDSCLEQKLELLFKDAH